MHLISLASNIFHAVPHLKRCAPLGSSRLETLRFPLNVHAELNNAPKPLPTITGMFLCQASALGKKFLDGVNVNTIAIIVLLRNSYFLTL